MDVVKVHDYFRELKEERRNCKCKDCKKHERYSTLYELSLPENIINNIYGFAYFCRSCQKRQFKKERIEGIIRGNILHEYDVDRLIFSIKHDFPIYDRVKMICSRNCQKEDIQRSNGYLMRLFLWIIKRVYHIFIKYNTSLVYNTRCIY